MPDDHQNQARQKIRELTQDVKEIGTFLTTPGHRCRNKDEEAAGIPCVSLLKRSFKFVFAMNQKKRIQSEADSVAEVEINVSFLQEGLIL